MENINEHWNRPEHLPPIATSLYIKLVSGVVRKGERPSYVSSRKGWLGYRTIWGDKLSNDIIIGWKYE